MRVVNCKNIFRLEEITRKSMRNGEMISTAKRFQITHQKAKILFYKGHLFKGQPVRALAFFCRKHNITNIRDIHSGYFKVSLIKQVAADLSSDHQQMFVALSNLPIFSHRNLLPSDISSKQW